MIKALVVLVVAGLIVHKLTSERRRFSSVDRGGRSQNVDVGNQQPGQAVLRGSRLGMYGGN